MNWLPNLSTTFLVIFSLSTAFAQDFTAVPEPQMVAYKPFTFSKKQEQKTYTPQTRQVGQTNKIVTSDDLMQQAQRGRNNNTPYYPPGTSPEQKQEITRKWIEQETRSSMPTADNGFKQKNSESTRQEMLNLLNESHRKRAAIEKSKYKVSPDYYKDLPNYKKAKNEIKDQLAGKKPISIKDAYFYAEAAYGNTHLTYKEYNKLIEKNKNYILDWLQQGNYDINDPEALHYGIQSFLSDTLYLTVKDPDNIFGGSHVVMHPPFYYDYQDYEAVKDRRNYFITKTLATGSGQCHTLPVTYLILAEALGVEANLTFVPHHSTVRYKNNAGTTLNFETTTGVFLPDQAYLDMQPAMAKGMKNSIFMSDITKKELLATILIDLGVSFILEHWFSDEEIVVDCIVTADKYFPQQEYINTSSLWIKKKTMSNRFNALVQEKGIKDLKEIEKYPEVHQAYLQLKNYLERAKALGLEDFPQSEYMDLMAYHDEKGRLQKAKNIDTKSKRDLFIKKKL